jgi:competence protein ComEC
LLPGEEGRLLCHLVLGTGPALPPDLVTAHRRTGLTHLLAVSGAHASMLAWMMGLLYRLCSGRRAWTSRTFRRTAGGLLLIYGAITGWEPPVFRALAAFGLMLIAAARGRRLSIHACLAFPALLTALLQPAELFGPSFCLSYAAVIGLSLAGAFRAMNPWQQWLALPLRASLWAVICTAPLTLLYFGQIAPWTLIATPLLGPVVAAMLGLAILSAILGLALPGPALILAAVLGPLTSLYDELVRAFAELPGAPVFAVSSPPIWLLVGFGIFGLVGLSLLRGRRGVALFCASLCIPHFISSPPDDEACLRMLAVGHGQACILQTPSGRQVLVDCGSLGNPRRAGRAVAAALRRRRIDMLVLSHGDQDHSGGIASLLDRIPIERAILPASLIGSPVARRLQAGGTELQALAPGQIWAEENMLIIAPQTGVSSSNEASLWLRVQFDELRCLLPGDAGRPGIRAFREMQPDAQADIFVLPHHGRGDLPAVRALLETLGPALALVSNRSSEQSTALGDLARQMGIPVLHTGNRGDIELRLDEGLRIECEYPARLEISRR